VTEIIRIRNTPGAAEAVGAVIGTSFHDLEVSAWIVPPDEDRRRALPPFFAMLTEHALTHGEVHATADMSAVAVWFHHDSGSPPDVPGQEARVKAFAGSHAERFGLLGEEMEKHHPTDPHHYLSFLAVLPEKQNRGLGSLLLEHHHGGLDAREGTAYLEASNARSRELYLRHGYRDLGDPLILPEGPPMFPMWRPPSP
jgi:GNAT superfamily N-acetyltransferase